MNRIISISAAPFDGYDLPLIFDSIAKLGATHVEPAFIVGYTQEFTEALFEAGSARRIRNHLQTAGLECHALSVHMDLSGEDAVQVFAGRMRFAAEIGAGVVISNAAPPERKGVFLLNIERLVRRAEELDLIVALENPGDGRPNLLDDARAAVGLVHEVNHDRVRLNFDPGNIPSHCGPEVDPIGEAVLALPLACHMHIKDVLTNDQGYWFTSIGEGSIDYLPLFDRLRSEYPALPISIEVPLRVHRALDGAPLRDSRPMPLEKIGEVLSASFRAVKRRLA